MADEDGRIQIPLRMLEGNIDVMLNNRIPCAAVSFMLDPTVKHGVILVFHGLNHEDADELGFKYQTET